LQQLARSTSTSPVYFYISVNPLLNSPIFHACADYFSHVRARCLMEILAGYRGRLIHRGAATMTASFGSALAWPPRGPPSAPWPGLIAICRRASHVRCRWR
jgi:hypothetical protein